MKTNYVPSFTSLAAIAALYFGAPCATSAIVITGTFADYPESFGSPSLTLGNGLHSVTVRWSVANPGYSGYFYGADDPYLGKDTEVAVGFGITSIEQIFDASVFSFTRGGTALVPEGSFVLFRNIHDGFYGVVRIDDIFQYSPEPEHSPFAGINGTWWFQTDGSSSFSRTAVPDHMSTGLTLFAMLCLSALIARPKPNQ